MSLLRRAAVPPKWGRRAGSTSTTTTTATTTATTTSTVNSDDSDGDAAAVDAQRYMHGRRNAERRDSVSKEMLMERMQHQRRLESVQVARALVDAVDALGLGTKRRKHTVYQTRQPSLAFDSGSPMTGSGFAAHLTSASKQWPVFKHVLPEIAFAGHSNSGKSTLVNAMVGVLPKKGPAGISERAGWTDQICFYQLGKKPPVLILADLPGHGHAVASSEDKAAWKAMTRDYLATRAATVLTKCCVLVDCTRGLCGGDRSLLRFLQQHSVPWQVVLTKCDLLPPLRVAQSLVAVEQDLRAAHLLPDDVGRADADDAGARLLSSGAAVVPVSAATGAGVQRLWLHLRDCARAATRPPRTATDGGSVGDGDDGDGDVGDGSVGDDDTSNPHAVREHVNAPFLRKADFLRQLNAYRT